MALAEPRLSQNQPRRVLRNKSLPSGSDCVPQHVFVQERFKLAIRHRPFHPSHALVHSRNPLQIRTQFTGVGFASSTPPPIFWKTLFRESLARSPSLRHNLEIASRLNGEMNSSTSHARRPIPSAYVYNSFSCVRRDV